MGLARTQRNSPNDPPSALFLPANGKQWPFTGILYAGANDFYSGILKLPANQKRCTYSECKVNNLAISSMQLGIFKRRWNHRFEQTSDWYTEIHVELRAFRDWSWLRASSALIQCQSYHFLQSTASHGPEWIKTIQCAREARRRQRETIISSSLAPREKADVKGEWALKGQTNLQFKN